MISANKLSRAAGNISGLIIAEVTKLSLLHGCLQAEHVERPPGATARDAMAGEIDRRFWKQKANTVRKIGLPVYQVAGQRDEILTRRAEAVAEDGDQVRVGSLLMLDDTNLEIAGDTGGHAEHLIVIRVEVKL